MTHGSDAAAGAVALAALFTGATVWAQAGQATDPAMAEALFREGKALMGRGEYASACPKLEESQRLDPGTGTLLALAYCHEHEGKLASAWAEYTTVLGAARQAGQVERVKVAGERVASIEPRLSRIVVRVAAGLSSRPGLEVKRDGIVLGEAVWGASVPVDPGEHVLEARAPGYKPWSLTEHTTPGAAVEVLVPQLQPEPVAVPSGGVAGRGTEARADGGATTTGTGSGSGGTSGAGGTGQVVGIALSAAGVAALSVGAYFGVRTFQKRDEANALCPVGQPCTNRDAISANDDAHTSAAVSTLAVGLGIASVGAGVYFLLASKPAPGSGATIAAARLAPLVGFHSLGLSCGAVW